MKLHFLIAFAALGALVATDPFEHHLVNVQQMKTPPLEEIRYATRYNFTGEQLYPFPAAYLHRDTIKALEAVQRDLAAEGLGLKIYDGYRPLSVQQKMWDLIQDERYVSNPVKNRGRHTRGTAVDVTLVDKLGRELPMPTDFDDFTEAAHSDSQAGSKEARANRAKLHAVMAKHGFEIYPYEWWHFDLHGWQNYPVLNISFENLAEGETKTFPVDAVSPLE